MYWMKYSHKYISLGHMAQKLKDWQNAGENRLQDVEVEVHSYD